MSSNYFMQFGSGDPRVFTGLNATFLIFKDKDGNNVTAPGITEVPSGTGIYYFTWGTTTSIAFLADAATTTPGTAGRYVFGALDQADRIDQFGVTLLALGTTNVALGTTNVALGTTNVALGTTNVALGTTNAALGTTNVALGTTNVALGITNVSLGTANTAFGTTNIAIGTSILAGEVALGSTLVGIGNTAIAIGLTITQMATNEGVTLVAIGNTLAAIGNSLSFGSSIFALIGTTASLIGDLTTDPGDLFGYLKRANELIQGRETFTKGSGALTMFDRTGATTLATRTVTNNASLVIKS